MKNKILTSIIAVLLALSSFLMGKVNQPKVQGSIGSDAKACTITKSSIVAIGKDIATTVFATSSNRAFGLIQIDKAATTTLSLTYNGAVATAANYSTLVNGAVGSSATTSLTYEVGLATPRPYTGAISALSTFGTTTALVTECLYK